MQLGEEKTAEKRKKYNRKCMGKLMKLKGHSQITYEEAHLFSTGAYMNTKNSKGSPKTEMVIRALLHCQSTPYSL